MAAKINLHYLCDRMTREPKRSALNVMGGVPQPGQINHDLVEKLKVRTSGSPEVREWIEGIRAGNRTILSQAITLVESSLKSHQEKAQEVISECLQTAEGGRRTADDGRQTASSIHHPASSIQHPASSIRIGITGVPGVGKSTFIEAFGKHLTAQGHKVAVLAIDPSSTKSKGSILGDKTRMEELAVDPNAFIRPSPSAGSLGGVARKTRETIILCEAAGFDVIIVETVGVGQSETAVHGMVDFFLLLMLAGAGDELQGIKRGIIEMADAIIINKADGDNLNKAKMAAAEYRNALHLYPPSGTGWTPVVDICSSVTHMGIPQVWEIISEYRQMTSGSGYFLKKRQEQDRQVLHEAIDEALKRRFYGNKEIHQLVQHLGHEIAEGRMNPYHAAKILLEGYHS
jgi:LAO/AO transport system kinase